MHAHRSIYIGLLFAGALLFIAACDDEDDGGGGGGTAVLQFNNSTQATPIPLTNQAAGFLAEAPSVLGIKLIAVYLSEDMAPGTGENIGLTQMIYLNPECNGDIENCNIYGDASFIVTSYFDFAQPSDDVNAQINAQERTIMPGTYQYVRMELYKDNGGQNILDTPNIKYQGGSMINPVEFIYGVGVVTAGPMVEPIAVSDGDSVTVTLGYDISTAFHDDPASASFCDGLNNCLTVPDFTPSASKGG